MLKPRLLQSVRYGFCIADTVISAFLPIRFDSAIAFSGEIFDTGRCLSPHILWLTEGVSISIDGPNQGYSMSNVAPPAIPNANPAPPPIPGVAPPKPRAAKPPVPRKRQPDQPVIEPDEEYEPSTFERLSVVISTSFGISMLAHIFLLMILGFWYFSEPILEELQIDSGISEKTPVAHLERIDSDMAPLPVKAKVTQTTRTLAIPITKTGPVGALVMNVPAPNVGSPAPSNGGGGSGKLFGSGREANSFVFVVDCSGSMTGQRFNRAISELIRVISDLKPTQRFYVVFYASSTIELFKEPGLVNLNTLPAMGANPLAKLNPGVQPNGPGNVAKRKPKVRHAPVRIINGRRVQGKLRTKKGMKVNENNAKQVVMGRARGLIPATDTYKALAQQWIHKLRAGGGTQPKDALEIALGLEPEVIYFLTDGQIPVDTPDVIKRANKGKVRVNTVALGYAGSEILLRRIATENKGTYKFVQ